MTDELKTIWKETVVILSKYYTDVCLEEGKKATKSLSKNNRCSGRDFNRETPEYKFGNLPLDKPVQSST
jgi:hypothetical protein